jgi:hypothetical protein
MAGKRLSRLVTRHWRELLKRRRELAAVRYSMQVPLLVGFFVVPVPCRSGCLSLNACACACVQQRCCDQLKKRIAFRSFMRGCRIWIDIRGPLPSEEVLYAAFMHYLATVTRRAFEALKDFLRGRRELWRRTVAWHDYVCVPRSFRKWARALHAGRK